KSAREVHAVKVEVAIHLVADVGAGSRPAEVVFALDGGADRRADLDRLCRRGDGDLELGFLVLLDGEVSASKPVAGAVRAQDKAPVAKRRVASQGKFVLDGAEG